jgi:hypothetical protein
MTPVQREGRREIALVGFAAKRWYPRGLAGGQIPEDIHARNALMPLERLETKKAGEASLWIASVLSGATCNETTDKPSCIKQFNPNPARMAGYELNANEGLMLLER